MSQVQLLHGDCLELLPGIPSESVDLVFADPPFNIGVKYNGNASKDRRKDYYKWCASWVYECFRVLKPTGSFYLMTLDKHLERLFPLMGHYGIFINLIRWRNVAADHSKRRFWASAQHILLYAKTEHYKFNQLAQRRAILPQNVRYGGYTTQPQGIILDNWDDIPNVYAGSIVHKEAILEPGTSKKVHPTQMPVNLADRCILFSTSIDDTVLDPMCGTGTVGVSCIKNGRNFIGMEIELPYWELANRRFSETEHQLTFGL